MERIGDYAETLTLLKRWLKLKEKYEVECDNELDIHRKVIELTQRVHGDDCLQAAHAFKGLGMAMHREDNPEAAAVLKRAHMLYHIYFGTGHKVVRRIENILVQLGAHTDIFATEEEKRAMVP